MSKAIDRSSIEVLTFSLDGQVFALPACYVREILDLVPVTEVPASTPFANGLINVRGKIVPLADLRHKLGMERRPPNIDTRIVVIEIDLKGTLTAIGIIAEKVHEVTGIAASAIEETPKVGIVWRQEYIRCIGKRSDDFVIVLDMPTIFASALRQKSEFCDSSKHEKKAA